MILAALNTILLANAYNLPLPTYAEAEDGHDSAVTGDDDTYQSNGEDSCSDEENALENDFVKAGQLYDDIMRDPDVNVVEEVLSSKALWRIMDKLNGKS